MIQEQKIHMDYVFCRIWHFIFSINKKPEGGTITRLNSAWDSAMAVNVPSCELPYTEKKALKLLVFQSIFDVFWKTRLLILNFVCFPYFLFKLLCCDPFKP